MSTFRYATPLELGTRVREARQKLGLSQSQLGSQIGASRFWVAAFERGKPGVELDLVLKALTAVGLTVNVSAVNEDTVKYDSAPAVEMDLDSLITNAGQKRGTSR